MKPRNPPSAKLGYFNTTRKGDHKSIERMLRAGSSVPQIAKALDLDEKFVGNVAGAVNRRTSI